MNLSVRRGLDPRIVADDIQMRQQVISEFLAEMRELRRFAMACEERHGIRPAEIHAAIDDGRLVETEEVCDWIFAVETLDEFDRETQ